MASKFACDRKENVETTVSLPIKSSLEINWNEYPPVLIRHHIALYILILHES